MLNIMHFESSFAEIEVINEPTYSFGSMDNPRNYPIEWQAPAEQRATAIHGILVDGEPLVVFGAPSATGVHEHSALFLHGQVLLAVGNHLISFCPQPYHLNWGIEVDLATCFGIHYQAENDALISQGELKIARIAEDGRILWSSSGADVFSEKLSLLPDCIEAINFNHNTYRFDYRSGVQDV